MNSAPDIRALSSLVVFIILVMGGSSFAQEASTTTPSGDSNQISSDLEDLQRKIEALELEKKLAETELDAIKAKWAISETKGKEGSITIEDDAGYFAEILAYSTLDAAAAEIAEKTIGKLNKDEELIILGDVDLAREKSLWNLLNLKLDLAINMIEEAINLYPKLLDEDAGKIRFVTEPLVALPAILGAITDIVAFFKSDYTLYSRKISLNEKALIAATANQISTHIPEVEILIPEYNLKSTDSLSKKIETLSTLICTLESKRSEIAQQVHEKNNNDPSKRKERKEAIISPLDKEIDAARKLVTTLISYTDSTASPLGEIATIDFIRRHPYAKILHLTIVSQGAEIETTEASLSRGRISYIAGVVVTYFLTNADGKYFQSGNAYEMKTKSFKPKSDPKSDLDLFDPPKKINRCSKN